MQSIISEFISKLRSTPPTNFWRFPDDPDAFAAELEVAKAGLGTSSSSSASAGKSANTTTTTTPSALAATAKMSGNHTFHQIQGALRHGGRPSLTAFDNLKGVEKCLEIAGVKTLLVNKNENQQQQNQQNKSPLRGLEAIAAAENQLHQQQQQQEEGEAEQNSKNNNKETSSSFSPSSHCTCHVSHAGLCKFCHETLRETLWKLLSLTTALFSFRENCSSVSAAFSSPSIHGLSSSSSSGSVGSSSPSVHFSSSPSPSSSSSSSHYYNTNSQQSMMLSLPSTYTVAEVAAHARELVMKVFLLARKMTTRWNHQATQLASKEYQRQSPRSGSSTPGYSRARSPTEPDPSRPSASSNLPEGFEFDDKHRVSPDPERAKRREKVLKYLTSLFIEHSIQVALDVLAMLVTGFDSDSSLKMAQPHMDRVSFRKSVAQLQQEQAKLQKQEEEQQRREAAEKERQQREEEQEQKGLHVKGRSAHLGHHHSPSPSSSATVAVVKKLSGAGLTAKDLANLAYQERKRGVEMTLIRLREVAVTTLAQSLLLTREALVSAFIFARTCHEIVLEFDREQQRAASNNRNSTILEDEAFSLEKLLASRLERNLINTELSALKLASSVLTPPTVFDYRYIDEKGEHPSAFVAAELCDAHLETANLYTGVHRHLIASAITDRIASLVLHDPDNQKKKKKNYGGERNHYSTFSAYSDSDSDDDDDDDEENLIPVEERTPSRIASEYSIYCSRLLLNLSCHDLGTSFSRLPAQMKRLLVQQQKEQKQNIHQVQHNSNNNNNQIESPSSKQTALVRSHTPPPSSSTTSSSSSFTSPNNSLLPPALLSPSKQAQQQQQKPPQRSRSSNAAVDHGTIILQPPRSDDSSSYSPEKKKNKKKHHHHHHVSRDGKLYSFIGGLSMKQVEDLSTSLSIVTSHLTDPLGNNNNNNINNQEGTNNNPNQSTSSSSSSSSSPPSSSAGITTGVDKKAMLACLLGVHWCLYDEEKMFLPIARTRLQQLQHDHRKKKEAEGKEEEAEKENNNTKVFSSPVSEKSRKEQQQAEEEEEEEEGEEQVMSPGGQSVFAASPTAASSSSPAAAKVSAFDREQAVYRSQQHIETTSATQALDFSPQSPQGKIRLHPQEQLSLPSPAPVPASSSLQQQQEQEEEQKQREQQQLQKEREKKNRKAAASQLSIARKTRQPMLDDAWQSGLLNLTTISLSVGLGHFHSLGLSLHCAQVAKNPEMCLSSQLTLAQHRGVLHLPIGDDIFIDSGLMPVVKGKSSNIAVDAPPCHPIDPSEYAPGLHPEDQRSTLSAVLNCCLLAPPRSVVELAKSNSARDWDAASSTVASKKSSYKETAEGIPLPAEVTGMASICTNTFTHVAASKRNLARIPFSSVRVGSLHKNSAASMNQRNQSGLSEYQRKQIQQQQQQQGGGGGSSSDTDEERNFDDSEAVFDPQGVQSGNGREALVDLNRTLVLLNGARHCSGVQLGIRSDISGVAINTAFTDLVASKPFLGAAFIFSSASEGVKKTSLRPEWYRLGQFAAEQEQIQQQKEKEGNNQHQLTSPEQLKLQQQRPLTLAEKRQARWKAEASANDRRRATAVLTASAKMKLKKLQGEGEGEGEVINESPQSQHERALREIHEASERERLAEEIIRNGDVPDFVEPKTGIEEAEAVAATRCAQLEVRLEQVTQERDEAVSLVSALKNEADVTSACVIPPLQGEVRLLRHLLGQTLGALRASEMVAEKHREQLLELEGRLRMAAPPAATALPPPSPSSASSSTGSSSGVSSISSTPQKQNQHQHQQNSFNSFSPL